MYVRNSRRKLHIVMKQYIGQPTISIIMIFCVFFSVLFGNLHDVLSIERFQYALHLLSIALLHCVDRVS